MPRNLIILSLLIVILQSIPFIALADESDPRGIAGENDVATLRTSRLECTIGNNKSYPGEFGDHNPGYNGVFSIKSPDLDETPFVPAYAGLNLEHYFDARAKYEENSFFEPRHSPMSLKRINENTVELHQPPTPNFAVESWTRFEVSEPYYLDFSFRFILHKDVFEGDFMGVFWASYINGPLNKSTYFLNAGSTLDKPLWRQLCTQQHNRDSTVRHESDSAELKFQKSNSTLFGSLSPLRYAEPFFYGRFLNMALIYVFEPNPHLRFAHSPSGGGSSKTGDDTNPAWDYQLVVPNYQISKEYSLNGRLIYKPWKDRADIIAEVRKYQSRR